MFYLSGQSSSEQPPILKTVDTFAIIGNPNRHGTPKTSSYLRDFLENNAPKKRVLFVPTGRTAEETRDNLESSSINDSPTCLVIIGGDGTAKNCLEAECNLLKSDPNNYPMWNLLTAFIGTAIDLPHNLGAKSSRRSFEKNFSQLKEHEFYPIELTVEDQTHKVYNVASFGVVGTMGANIEDIKSKIPANTPRVLQLGLASIAIFKTLSKHSSFEITDQEGNYHKAIDWIVANGKRFGVAFQTAGTETLHPSFAEYDLDKLDMPTILRVIFRRPNQPNAIIKAGETTTRNYRSTKPLKLTVDGEVIILPTEGTVSARVATEEPIKVFAA